MVSENLYQTLEIPEYSDISVVKKAFRKFALLYHPDRNPDPEAAEKFKTVLKVYQILSDPELKHKYDYRLRNGYDSGFEHRKPEESESERRKRDFVRRRREQKEMEELQNLVEYEKSLENLSFIWRNVIIGLLLITGIFNIVNDWYQIGNKIAFGIVMFVVAVLLLWNEYYKHYWYKAVIKDESTYPKQASSVFITVFFTGVFLIFGLVKVKKIWQLNTFGKVIDAGVDHKTSRLYFTYDKQFYSFYIYSLPKEFEDKEQIPIRISTQEPEIWEYIED